MKVIRRSFSELSKTEKTEIDKFVDIHDGLIFHETKFNEIASKIYKTNLFYFIAYINDEMVGICPVHAINDGVLKLLFSHMSSHEIPYGGWIYNENKISIKSLLNNIILNFNESLLYSSTIQIDKNEYEEIDSNNITRMNTLILDLSPSIDDLFNFHITTQQRKKIRRAQKLGITIEKIPITNMDEFINLSNELTAKVGLPIRVSELYKKIVEIYSKEDKAVCLAAKYESHFISSMILIASKKFTIAWVAGRKVDLPNNLYQNELLFWESIIWAKQFGSRYLDLCGLDELKFPQLARIKLSFSKEVAHFYVLSKKNFSFRVINKIRKLQINVINRIKNVLLN